MTLLDRVVEIDPERGLVTVEAGIDWPTPGASPAVGVRRRSRMPWGIIQKQTGADRLTIGGALASNIHGRGLRLGRSSATSSRSDLVDRDRRRW